MPHIEKVLYAMIFSFGLYLPLFLSKLSYTDQRHILSFLTLEKSIQYLLLFLKSLL